MIHPIIRLKYIIVLFVLDIDRGLNYQVFTTVYLYAQMLLTASCEGKLIYLQQISVVSIKKMGSPEKAKIT
jgi:hypothetical protein